MLKSGKAQYLGK